MGRGNVIWIHSDAPATVAKSVGGIALGFDTEALPRFANLDEARRCAEEIVALLRRYSLKAEIRTE